MFHYPWKVPWGERIIKYLFIIVIVVVYLTIFFFTTVKRYRQGSDCSFHSESSASPQSEVDVGEWIRALTCNVSIVCSSGTKAHEIGHFQVSKILTFKTRLSAKIFLVNEFYLNENEKSFSYQWLCTRPRFKTEAWGNSEMAFWHAPNVPGLIALIKYQIACIISCYDCDMLLTMYGFHRSPLLLPVC